MREVVAEGVLDIEQRDSRRVRDRFVQICGGRREPIRECRRRPLGAERLMIERRQRAVQILKQRAQLAVFCRDYYFARRDSRDFLAQRRGLAHLRREKFASRDVERRQREPDPLGARDRDQVTFLGRRQHHLLAHGAGRDHAHDLPRHQLRRLGVGRALLADRDLVPRLQQLGDVRFRGMVGHAAQRHAVLVARGELDIEHARADFGVLEEHLVEIAEAEKQDRVGDALLDAEILRDEGCLPDCHCEKYCGYRIAIAGPRAHFSLCRLHLDLLGASVNQALYRSDTATTGE